MSITQKKYIISVQIFVYNIGFIKHKFPMINFTSNEELDEFIKNLKGSDKSQENNYPYFCINNPQNLRINTIKGTAINGFDIEVPIYPEYKIKDNFDLMYSLKDKMNNAQEEFVHFLEFLMNLKKIEEMLILSEQITNIDDFKENKDFVNSWNNIIQYLKRDKKLFIEKEMYDLDNFDKIKKILMKIIELQTLVKEYYYFMNYSYYDEESKIRNIKETKNTLDKVLNIIDEIIFIDNCTKYFAIKSYENTFSGYCSLERKKILTYNKN